MKISARIGTLCIASVFFLGLLESLRNHRTEQQESVSSLEIVHAAATPERTPAAPASTLLAATPPLGWNSWDGYGTTVNEDQVKANAKWFAEHLKPAGWQYVVVDMEWFVTNPTPQGNSKTSLYSLDANGRYTPALNRFPSAANEKGFKPLGDYIHSLGLKFGIHICAAFRRKQSKPICRLLVRTYTPLMQPTLPKHARGIQTIMESMPQSPELSLTTIRSSPCTPVGESMWSR